MKNTTFRKKALLSSVAMLLVALVALGSATFAWFTSSTSATASDLGASTTKSSELLVAKKDLDFKDSITYSKGLVLRPATSADGENWYKAEAATKTNFAAKDGNFTPVNGDANYYFVDMLNIKNNGGTACTNVTISITADMPSTFARLAVVPCATQTEKDKMPTVASTDFKANIYGADAADAWTPYNIVDAADGANDYKIKAVANGAQIVIPSLAAGAVVSYKVMLWFEGEDSDCFDTTTAKLDAPAISFSVTGNSSQG